MAVQSIFVTIWRGTRPVFRTPSSAGRILGPMEPSGGAPLPDVALDGESVQLTPHAGAEDWVAAPPAADETPPVPKKTKGKLVGSALLLVAAGALLALLSKLADREQKVEPPPAPPLPEGLLLPPQPVEVFKPPASQQASQAESEAQMMNRLKQKEEMYGGIARLGCGLRVGESLSSRVDAVATASEADPAGDASVLIGYFLENCRAHESPKQQHAHLLAAPQLLRQLCLASRQSSKGSGFFETVQRWGLGLDEGNGHVEYRLPMLDSIVVFVDYY
ncbi:hypothetical protein EBH_0009030 [Eimeria brunetti]|uniref:Uncharacterized protein n=1 Tax=Eimeria brunetti TaxID=51314 RepID=U6M1F8_9EIME|nr:hypothetical protein EBH_0009030 [Eimeria brunetti]